MNRRTLTLLSFLLLFQIIAIAQDTNDGKSLKPQGKKPKVALVLSGGGAKGLAHIPTLQALDSLGIVPDLVVGNSMGSIVGALYAMGYSGDSIVSIVNEAHWDKLMGGGVSLQNVSAAEKSEYDKYLIQLDFSSRKLRLGSYLLNDQNLREFITMLTSNVYDVNDFDKLPIPFRAMATDIITGQEVTLSKGSLALAMRASMSIPGVFQAVSYEETLLVDGGLLNNFPVDIAKKLGADIIIGSDVGMLPLEKKDLEDLTTLMFQTTMLNSNIKRPQNRELCDILIDHNDYLTYSTGDFNKALKIYEQGKGAVAVQMDALAALAKRLKQYEQREVKLPPTRGKFTLDSITYSGISDPNLKYVKARTNIDLDTSYEIKDVIAGVNRAMGTTLFKRMEYAVIAKDDKLELELHGVERSPHQVKGSLHYDSYHGVGIIGNYTGRNIIGNASRTLITADIAEQPKLRIQYQKNFGHNRNWWWRTELYGQQLKQKVFVLGEYVDNVRNTYHSIDNQFNRNLSSLRSYIGVGVKYDNTNLKPIFNPRLIDNFFNFKKYNNYDIELYGHYDYNSMDKVHFATWGTILKGYLGRSLHGNLKLDFKDDSILDYDGSTDGYTRLGFDYEKRFPTTSKIVTIFGASAHFILEDTMLDDDDISDMILSLNPKYFLGGNVNSPRNEYFVFPGLREEEVVVSQFVKMNLALQLNVFNNIFITPHFDIASVGFGDFDDYIEDTFPPKGKWSNYTDPSILLSAGTTFSYNSVVGPINFDLSWVNNTDKVQFFIGIGLQLNKSD